MALVLPLHVCHCRCVIACLLSLVSLCLPLRGSAPYQPCKQNIFRSAQHGSLAEHAVETIMKFRGHRTDAVHPCLSL